MLGRIANLSQPNGQLLMESRPGSGGGVKSDDVGSMDEGLHSS
jgi:hypothetical protein